MSKQMGIKHPIVLGSLIGFPLGILSWMAKCYDPYSAKGLLEQYFSSQPVIYGLSGLTIGIIIAFLIKRFQKRHGRPPSD